MKVRLDIESLRAFKTVVESRSVTRAARKLNLTQSAVSHKIKRLEQRIGRPLLSRNRRGLEVTEDGAWLLKYAERLVGIHDEATALFSRVELSGRIRLGMMESIAGSRIARIFARFSTVYPNVSFVSRVSHSLTLADWLQRGEIDLALMQLFGQQPHANDRVLWRDDIIWVQSEDFQLLRSGDLPFIAFQENCFYRTWATEALARLNLSLRIVLECPSIEGVTNAVRSRLGVSLLGRQEMRSGLLESRLGLPKPPGVVNVARPAVEKPARTVRVLLDAIEEEYGGHGTSASAV